MQAVEEDCDDDSDRQGEESGDEDDDEWTSFLSDSDVVNLLAVSRGTSASAKWHASHIAWDEDDDQG